jgi:hypothetical protein
MRMVFLLSMANTLVISVRLPGMRVKVKHASIPILHTYEHETESGS